MVKREKFLMDAKAEPARFYRTPNDVLRDRRLADDDRREILGAWKRSLGDDPDPVLIEGIRRALDELGEDGGDAAGRRNQA